MPAKFVMHIDVNGSWRFFSDELIDFYIIDERSPNDRVYNYRSIRPLKTGDFERLVGDDPIGRLGDPGDLNDRIREVLFETTKPEGHA